MNATCQHGQPAALAGLHDADAQMMMQVRYGDTSAFELLVRKHRASILHYMSRMVRDRAIAEELTQDTFLRLFGSRETYQPSAKFNSWLYLIARRVALNWIRDHRRERMNESIDAQQTGRRPFQLHDPAAHPDERLVRQVRHQAVRQAVRQLPERQQVAIMLHKFEWHDCIEIAGILHCSHQAVRSLLFRAYAALRITLAPIEAQG